MKKIMMVFVVLFLWIAPSVTVLASAAPSGSAMMLTCRYSEPISEEDLAALNEAELYRDNVLAVQPDNIYSVWAEPGLHLMMSDNGTPGNYDDDWVVDWENNRKTKIIIND